MVDKNPAAAALGRLGGKAKAASMTKKERSEEMRERARTLWDRRSEDERREATEKLREGARQRWASMTADERRAATEKMRKARKK